MEKSKKHSCMYKFGIYNMCECARKYTNKIKVLFIVFLFSNLVHLPLSSRIENERSTDIFHHFNGMRIAWSRMIIPSQIFPYRCHLPWCFSHHALQLIPSNCIKIYNNCLFLGFPKFLAVLSSLLFRPRSSPLTRSPRDIASLPLSKKKSR